MVPLSLHLALNGVLKLKGTQTQILRILASKCSKVNCFRIARD